MRYFLSIVAVLCLTWSHAQLSIEEPVISAETGRFAAVSFRAPEGVTVRLEGPSFFVSTGEAVARDGISAIYLFVDHSAPAGEHTIFLRDENGNSAMAVINVARRTAIELSVPTGMTVVRGESLEYEVQVHNAGNAVELVSIEVRGGMVTSEEPVVIELGPGDHATTSLGLWRADVARGDVAVVVATPSSDLRLSRFGVIRTTVLPFDGASDLDDLSLSYRVDGSVRYATFGPSGRVGVGIAGALSDFVTVETELMASAPTSDNLILSGEARLFGANWRAGYFGSAGSHRVFGDYEDVGAFFALSGASSTIGVTYRPNDFYVSATHSNAPVSRQTLTSGYAFRVTPVLTLVPSLSVVRTADSRTAVYATALSLGAQFDTSPFVGHARMHLPYPLDDAWRADVAVVTRASRPIGARADLSVTHDGLAGRLTVNEVVNEQLTLQQRLSYDGTTELKAVAHYRLRFAPVSLSANVGTKFEPHGVEVSYGASASYRPRPFALGVNVSGSMGKPLAYGASVGYGARAWSTTASYAHTDASDRLSVSLAARAAGFTASASYQYDLLEAEHGARVGLSYQPADGYTVFGNLQLADTLNWTVGASFAVQGAIATPDGVIETFGGRRTGAVSGVVFLDQNRDGVRDAAEPTLNDLFVGMGDHVVGVTHEGLYRIDLPPGSYRLVATGMPASLGLREPLLVEVVQGQVNEVDVPMLRVASAIALVFDDANRNGQRDDGEKVAPAVTVTFLDESGATAVATTNVRGEALLQNAAPGAYTISIATQALPADTEATMAPLAVDIEPGPITLVQLGIASRPRESVRTLAAGDMILVAQMSHSSAPPGADVLVTADVVGRDVDATTRDDIQVYARIQGGAEVPLLPVAGGSYQARLRVPDDATALVLVTVTAREGSVAREHVLPLRIVAGPLAAITVTPALADPEEVVRIEAAFLTLVATASVVVDGTEHELHATADPYVFRSWLNAPGGPGSYEVELLGDGKVFTTGHFRVQ